MIFDTFWNSSVQEIRDYIESFQRNRRRQIKERTMELFLLAELISERDPLTDKKKTKMTMPWDCYPDLFAEEAGQQEQAKTEAEFESYKEKRRMYVREFNARRHPEKEGGE